MVVKTSGWHAIGEVEVMAQWAEGEAVEELEGEAMDDYVATDGEFLASELAIIDGELETLRGHYRTCRRAFARSRDAAVCKEAVRKARAIRAKADELLAAKAALLA